MKYNDSDDEDEQIKKGDRAIITGGVKETVNAMMTVDMTTKYYYWLKDDEGNIYRRAKTNVKKVIKNK